MDTFRKTKAIRAFLEALQLTDGYPLEDGVVRTHVKDMVKPALSDREWTMMVDVCISGDLVKKVTSKLDAALVQYTITERGEAAIA